MPRSWTRQVRACVAVGVAVAALSVRTPARADFSAGTFETCHGNCDGQFALCKDDCCVLEVGHLFAVCHANCLDVCHLNHDLCVGFCGALSGPANIDPTATIDAKGRTIRVTGPIECPPDLRLRRLRVTVSQRGAGAVAQGTIRAACTGTAQQFSVLAHVRRGARFLAGDKVDVCALAQLGASGVLTDAKQWCAQATLLLEGTTLVDD